MTQILEGVLLEGVPWRAQVALNVVLWASVGALAAWLLLSWAVVQEQRYRSAQVSALTEQRRLNMALQHANGNLALLNEVNRSIVSSASADEVLDYAATLPTRVLGATASTIVLLDDWASVPPWPKRPAPLVLRYQGVDGPQLGPLRTAFGLDALTTPPTLPTLIPALRITMPTPTCLVVPLRDGDDLVGWVECYLPSSDPPHPDSQELMATIAGEIAEALGAARRRTAELESRYALDRAVDEERARIARDMHDGIAQNLAFLRMRADLWSDWLETEPERLPTEFAALKANLRDQIDELRRAIFALRPVDLNELGFAGALRRLVDDFANQQGWQASLSIGTLTDLPPALELACFRLVQESLNNVAKHAAAGTVRVSLAETDGGLAIAVADNGRGFDPATLDSSNRLGLRQMRERIASLGGRLTLIARPGQGTEVQAWVPL
jgi:signal transduction histidine kinase